MVRMAQSPDWPGWETGWDVKPCECRLDGKGTLAKQEGDEE